MVKPTPSDKPSGAIDPKSPGAQQAIAGDVQPVKGSPLFDNISGRIFPEWTADLSARAGGYGQNDGDLPYERIAVGAVLREGTYGIVNAKYERVVSLTSAITSSPVLSVPSNEGTAGLKWEIKAVREGGYSLSHSKYGLRADTAPALSESTRDESVVGKPDNLGNNFRWDIKQSKVPGLYTIAAWSPGATSSMTLCWYLDNGDTNTTVTLRSSSDSLAPPSGFHWHFVPLGRDVYPLFRMPYPFVSRKNMSYIRSIFPSGFSLQSDFTIMAWVMQHETSDWGTLISFESPQSTTTLFTLLLPPTKKPGALRVQYSSGYGTEDVHSVDANKRLPPPDVWFHLAVVARATPLVGVMLDVYINGQLESTPVIGRIFETQSVSAIMGWHRLADVASGQWDGAVAHLEVYQAALSDSDINKHKARATLPEFSNRLTTVPKGDDQMNGSDAKPTQQPAPPVNATGPIQTNNYKIVNVGTSGVFAAFDRAGSGVSVKASTYADATSVQWKVESKDSHYIITSRLYGLYGPYTSNNPSVGDAVVTAASSKFEWLIKETSTPGRYVIYPYNNDNLSWGLTSPTEVVRLADAKEEHAMWNFQYL